MSCLGKKDFVSPKKNESDRFSHHARSDLDILMRDEVV